MNQKSYTKILSIHCEIIFDRPCWQKNQIHLY